MIMVGLVGGVSYHHHRRCLAWIWEFAISHKYGLVRWLGASAQRVGFFNIGSGRVGYWTKYRVSGRVRVG